MNRIEVNFDTCSPSPSAGYEIRYRIQGSMVAYTDAGNFFISPAVFYDDNPEGTQYEGVIRSDCGGVFGNPVYWYQESGGMPQDNSSCGTTISQETLEPTYQDLGFFIIHVDGAASVDLDWDVFDRPDRFALYDNGNNVQSTGWRGTASYPGPWGASLSTDLSGVITFVPVAGHEYKIGVEAGPADPENVLSDNFNILITCSYS